MALSTKIKVIGIAIKYFFGAVVILLLPLGSSMVFLYDKILFINISFFKLNTLVLAMVFPAILVNSYFIFFALSSYYLKSSKFQVMILIPSLFLSLVIVFLLLIGVNIALLGGANPISVLYEVILIQFLLCIFFLIFMFFGFTKSKWN